jgi:diguanylate cyclase (GGDEF)-like protein
MTGLPASLWKAARLIGPQTRFAVWLVLLALLLVSPGQSASARAAEDAASDGLPLSSFCHASTALPPLARDQDVPGRFFCGGRPEGYQHGSLWLVGGARTIAPGGRTPVLMVHSSRFDRLLVGFRYADGAIIWQDVHSGDFSGHWRLGGQIGFAAPLRDARLTGLVLRFDRLALADALRMRLVKSEVSDLQTIALASLIGAALMLLLIGAVYNFALGIAARRLFPMLQGIWSAVMALWGTIWSQLHLFVLPGMAGTVSSQIDTVLALMLLMLTALSLICAIEPGKVPRWLCRVAVTLAVLVGVMGLPLGLMRSGAIEQIAMAVAVLFAILVVIMLVCLAIAWRRGSTAAQAFAGAWLVPLLVMSLTGFFNVGDMLWGGGEQMLVLLSGAWQTIWLSVAATRRFNLLRQERDAAVASQAVAHDQARRDPLTGLGNRRSFVERIAPLLAAHDQAVAGDAPGDETGALTLLLLDIDQFKLVNDRHGHDAGDAVLITIARRLERWDSPAQVVARMGGEEFAIMVAGMGLFAVRALAESMRQAIAACDHGDRIGKDEVTVSIGLVMARPGDTFATLYRAADAALYAAKHQGRNRVVIGHTTVVDAATAPAPPQADIG